MSEAQTPAEPTVNLRRILVNAAPPRAAHHASWTQVGNQILLEVGYFDLYAIQQQMASGEEAAAEAGPAASAAHTSNTLNIDWFITDRYLLDFETGERLARTFAALAAHLDGLRASGEDDGTAQQ